MIEALAIMAIFVAFIFGGLILAAFRAEMGAGASAARSRARPWHARR